MLTYDEVREVLVEASARGMILAIPREEWPPGTRRDERVPDTIPLEYENEHITMLAIRKFSLTPGEAKLFIALLRRPAMTKNSLHTVVIRNEQDPPTDIKIVDVYVCKLRKKLPVEISDAIMTIWGKGYFITSEGKAKAYELLGVKPAELSAGVVEGGGREDAGSQLTPP
jgi:hypothetical protein